MRTFSTIGQNVRLFRDKFSMTQEALSSYLGISREQLSYYENGSREIPFLQLEKICSLFGIEIDDLTEENHSDVTLKVAFAFRANELKNEDYAAIANFQDVVKNFINMKKLALSYL